MRRKRQSECIFSSDDKSLENNDISCSVSSTLTPSTKPNSNTSSIVLSEIKQTGRKSKKTCIRKKWSVEEIEAVKISLYCYKYHSKKGSGSESYCF